MSAPRGGGWVVVLTVVGVALCGDVALTVALGVVLGLTMLDDTLYDALRLAGRVPAVPSAVPPPTRSGGDAP